MINEALATLDDITHWSPAASCGSLQMLRLDQLHPVVSGNKWYKLKHNAAEAIAGGKDTLLTFGGGHSNHLVATAFAAREWGLKSTGLVRGDYTGANPTETLKACAEYGMELIPLSKAEYAIQKEDPRLADRFPGAHIIPEGGANAAGIRGAAEIASLIPADTTDVCLAVGTGTTLSGLASALPAHMRLHGFYVAKDFERTSKMASRSANPSGPEVLFHQVQDARFGKWTADALSFIRVFYNTTGIPLDVVYTSKMMMKLESMLRSGWPGSPGKIVCIHTGGLQGNPPGLFLQ